MYTTHMCIRMPVCREMILKEAHVFLLSSLLTLNPLLSPSYHSRYVSPFLASLFILHYLCVADIKGDFFGSFLFMYNIQYCFICRPSDSTVSKDAGIVPRTVATPALAVRRSNHSDGSHPHSARSHPHLLDFIHNSARSYPHSARSHPLWV
jgi:hypothetical protein